MLGLETIGLAARLLLSVASGDSWALLKHYFVVVRDVQERYHPFAGLVLVTFFAPDATRLIDQIDTYVLQSDAYEVQQITKSLASGLGMNGVAAAIVAQVALRALNLDDGDGSDSVHWTVNACNVVALMCALFSVAFTCFAHTALTTLHSSERMKEWLSQAVRRECASPYAVMMLLAPGRLLSISISALLVGFGILLGLLYTKGPARDLGRFSGLATLITYILASLFASAMYFLPQAMKEAEIRKARTDNKPDTMENESLDRPLRSAQ